MIKKIFSSFNLQGFIVGLVIILLSCLIFYSFGDRKPKLLSDLDYRMMDVMFHTRGPVPDSKQVVIIDIDEKSLDKIGQWPWPRNVLANLTSILIENKARAIGYDILFAETDRTSPHLYFKNLPKSLTKRLPQDFLSDLLDTETLDYDIQFSNSLSKGPTVLGYAFKTHIDGLKTDEDLPFPSGSIDIHPASFTIKNLNLLPAYRAIVNHPSVAASQSEGFFNVFADDAGITRQVPLLMRMDNIPYPSLALETYRLGISAPSVRIHVSQKLKMPRPPILGIQMQTVFIPTDSFAQLFINYRGPVNSFKYISAVDIINGLRTDEINDKYVLIGSSAKGLQDLRTTPFSNAIPGVEINATVIDNLINGDPFIYDRLTEIGLTYALIAGGGILIAVTLSVFGPLAGSTGAVLIIISGVYTNYLILFLNNQYVGMTYPLVTCALILLTTSVFNAFKEQKTKKYIRKAFSHYVAKDVVSEMIKNPRSLSLKGEEKDLTVLFSDIRGFTGISERMPSKALGYFMNDYLSRMSKIIIRNNGTVDKFIGDAVMAFWGAPREDTRHAFKAVQAAIEMKAETMKMAAEFARRDLPEIRIGIGINTGKMSVGNFGSNERFDYTVMGDNVNLASRLEGANKNYETTILISETTRGIISKEFFCRYIDKVQVKGRTQPIDLYEPLTSGSPDAGLYDEVNRFEKGVRAYQKQQFTTALGIINSLNQNNPAQLYQSYIDRIEAFLAAPPPSEWEGTERRRRLPVNKLTTK